MLFNSNSSLFVNKAPSNQNIINIFGNSWKTRFPDFLEVVAGESNYFDDQRVEWVSSEIGGLKGKSVVELGPFEAYNTYQLSKVGASQLTAVEGNQMNFLKCLAVKEMLNFNCKFKLGDCTLFLETHEGTIDLIFASGILYHQTDPLRFLKACSDKTKNIFIWTHYFDEMLLDDPKNCKFFRKDKSTIVNKYGFECVLFPRFYNFDHKGPPQLFSGGFHDFAYWMKFNDIINFLNHLGFEFIEVRSKGIHPAGPITSLLASKE